MKKVKDMDPYPLVSSENVLLAESSFMAEQDKPSVSNGYHPERMEKMAKSMSPSQDRYVEVGKIGFLKICLLFDNCIRSF